MATRFERDVERRADGPRSGDVQRFDLGVRPAEAAMISFADDLGPVRDDAADHRIRLDRAATERRKLQRPGHVPGIEFAIDLTDVARASCGGSTNVGMMMS